MGNHYETELDQCVRTINPVINSSSLTVEEKIAWRRLVLLLNRLALTTAHIEDDYKEQRRIKAERRQRRLDKEGPKQVNRYLTIMWLRNYETDQQWAHKRIGGKGKQFTEEPDKHGP